MSDTNENQQPAGSVSGEGACSEPTRLRANYRYVAPASSTEAKDLIEINGNGEIVDCWKCGGTGSIPGFWAGLGSSKKCPVCGGKSWLVKFTVGKPNAETARIEGEKRS